MPDSWRVLRIAASWSRNYGFCAVDVTFPTACPAAESEPHTMIRFFASVLLGLLIGIIVGLYLGWVQFPVEYIDSPARDLAQRYKDEYTVMVASGYLLDGDALGAIERLSVLGIDNAATFVQEVTERYITNSRDVGDIRRLVTLAEGLGRLMPIMEPYRQLSTVVPRS